MKKTSSFVWMGMVSLTTMFLFLSAPFIFAETAPMKLSLAYYGPPSGHDAEVTKWWAEEVKKRTNGAVEIKIYWGGALATAREIPEAVRIGTADIGHTVWAPYSPEKFPLSTLPDFPIPFITKPLATWLAREQVAKEFSEFDQEYARQNLKRLTYYGVGNMHVISRKPIRSLDDLKGTKIRASGKMHTGMLKAAGAVPVFIPAPAAIEALQKGVIDGTTCTITWAVAYKYHETPAKYLTQIGMGGDPGLGECMNLDVWKKLPDNIKKVLQDLREECPLVAEKLLYEETEKVGLKGLKEARVEMLQLPAADIERWKKLPEVVELEQQWFDFVLKAGGHPKERTKKMLDRFKGLVEEFGKRYPREF